MLLFARAHELPVTIRGGGHDVAGTALVDPSAARVEVEPGVLLGGSTPRPGRSA